jgi:hypothetical protein
VRGGRALTEAFESLIGVMTGDTASPILWDIFFSDLSISDRPDDILLAGRPISHAEHADDVVIFSTSIVGLQRKVDEFCRWYCYNSTTASIQKSEWMIFGPLPFPLPIIRIGGSAIKLVDSYKLVGLIFVSTTSMKRANIASGSFPHETGS